MRRTYSVEEASAIAESLKIDFASRGFDLEQFRRGLDVEAEHGQVDPLTNVTDDDPITTGKIALAHLNEIPDYYTRLQAMEASADSGASADAPQKARGLASKILLGFAAASIGILSLRSLRKRRMRVD